MYGGTLAYRYQSFTNEKNLSRKVFDSYSEELHYHIAVLKLVSFLQMPISFEIFVLQLQDKLTTADAYLNKPSSIFLPPA